MFGIILAQDVHSTARAADFGVKNVPEERHMSPPATPTMYCHRYQECVTVEQRVAILM